MTPSDNRTPVRHVTVSAEEAGRRLDKFLAEQLHGIPQGAIQKLLRTGQVRLNKGRAKGNARIAEGDVVRLPPVTLSEPGGPEKKPVPRGFLQELPGRILFQDDDMLVLDKPVGVPVHGGSGQPWGVVDAVKELFRSERWKGVPELCHRLDKETSGCLLFGLRPPMVRKLAEAFRDGEAIDKRYLVLVSGRPSPGKGVIDKPLRKGRVQGGERMVTVEEGGDVARTEYRVVEPLGDFSLVEARLLTGRTHQIRVHFESLGHPVAGDGKYGDRGVNRRLAGLGMKRMFLHARSLSLTHPGSGRRVQVQAPLDEALNGLLKALRP